MTNSGPHINYIELPATDMAPTLEFYEQVFGWQWNSYGPTYAAREDSVLTVALATEADSAPSHETGRQTAIGPLVLFETDDLEGVEARIVAAGGEIVSAPYGYPGGSRFHFEDPSGNTLAVYQSS